MVQGPRTIAIDSEDAEAGMMRDLGKKKPEDLAGALPQTTFSDLDDWESGGGSEASPEGKREQQAGLWAGQVGNISRMVKAGTGYVQRDKSHRQGLTMEGQVAGNGPRPLCGPQAAISVQKEERALDIENLYRAESGA